MQEQGQDPCYWPPSSQIKWACIGRSQESFSVPLMQVSKVQDKGLITPFFQRFFERTMREIHDDIVDRMLLQHSLWNSINIFEYLECKLKLAVEKLPRQEFEPFNRKTGLQLSKVLVASLGMKAEQSCTARFTSDQTRFGETPAIEYLRCGISMVTNGLARLKTRNQAKQLLPGMEEWMFEAPIKPANRGQYLRFIIRLMKPCWKIDHSTANSSGCYFTGSMNFLAMVPFTETAMRFKSCRMVSWFSQTPRTSFDA